MERARVQLSIAIQAHPSRAPLAAALTARIPAVAVYDPDPDSAYWSPWRTYRACLETTPAWATHRLILQDDVTLCQDFYAAALLAVAARPSQPISFFHGGEPSENLGRIDWAASVGEHFAELDSTRFIPAVALAWPASLIGPALGAVDRMMFQQLPRADDEVIRRALDAISAPPVLATVPSLIEHEDVVPSLTGKQSWAGVDKGRVAHQWIGLEASPLNLPWR